MIGSVNDLSPVGPQGIIWTSVDVLSIVPQQTNEIWSKFKLFHKRECSPNYRVQKSGHLVLPNARTTVPKLGQPTLLPRSLYMC